MVKKNDICKELSSVKLTDQAFKSASELIGRLGNNQIYEYRHFGRPERVLGDIEEMADYDRSGKESLPSVHTSVENFLRNFNIHLHIFLSPANDYVVHQIRNIIYWVTAEQLRVSYVPDTFRVEWISGLTNTWRNTLSQSAYSVVAEAFLTNAEEVFAEDEPMEILLPQIPALILERAKSRPEIIEAMLDVRHEFESFRKTFSELGSVDI
jgi:hypothetical protein